VRRLRAAHSLATARTGHQSGEQREINSRPIAREQRLIVIGVGHISKSATNQLKQRRHLKRYFGAAMALARLSFVLLAYRHQCLSNGAMVDRFTMQMSSPSGMIGATSLIRLKLPTLTLLPLKAVRL
jgi:GTP-binding protein EngB required for normal cell division